MVNLKNAMSSISDLSSDRFHRVRLGLLHAVDRKRREHLQEPEESHSFQEGRCYNCK